MNQMFKDIGFRPLLGVEADIDKIKYPVYVTPKLDGIRAMKFEILYSRSLKPIPNNRVQHLCRELPQTLDGELMCGVCFSDCTSVFMSHSGWADNITYNVFDYMITSDHWYLDRVYMLQHHIELPDWCVKILPNEINSKEELLATYEMYLSHGYEGMIIRSNGKYKFGRSTMKEGILLKWKPFVDTEGTVIGFKEKMTNTSSIINELGLKDKTSKKEDLVPAGTLGSLVVKWNNIEVDVGSGLNDALRQDIWNNQNEYLNRIVKFKYLAHGMVDKPRHPIFLGFRSTLDL